MSAVIPCTSVAATGFGPGSFLPGGLERQLVAPATATLRFKARWLHGWPEALLRLNGNWLEARVPCRSGNLGSPGLPNSRYATNAGPAIYNVTHNPTVPAANQRWW